MVSNSQAAKKGAAQSRDSLLDMHASVRNAPPQERYKFKPYPGSSHLWALAALEQFETDTRVLDIGSGSGALGQALGERGYQHCVAVEVDSEARKCANEIYLKAYSSVHELVGQQFEVILLLDVLEHIAHPAEFLKEVTELLASNGQLLLSVPNVAHWSVRVPLLLGWFEYSERGIMDKTHLQFFTRRRLRKFLADFPELYTVDWDASVEPFQFVLPEWLWGNALFAPLVQLRIWLGRKLPGLMAYQHLVALRKR